MLTLIFQKIKGIIYKVLLTLNGQLITIEILTRDGAKNGRTGNMRGFI